MSTSPSMEGDKPENPPTATATEPEEKMPAVLPTREKRAPGSNRAPPQVTDAARGRDRRTGADSRQPPAPLKGLVPDADETPKPARVESTRPRNALLQGSRYAINVHLWKIADGTTEAKGSILSQSLQKTLLEKAPGKYAGDVSLAQMRKLAPGMSSFARIHKFCTAEGVLVSDETISLDEYLALDANEDGATPARKDSAEGEDAKEVVKASTPSVPRLHIYYRSTASADYAALAANTTPAAAPALNMQMSGQSAGQDGSQAVGPGAATAADTAAPILPASTIAQDTTLGSASHGNYYSVSAGTLTEAEWAVVLRNCSVFYGWKIDQSSQRIVRAPRQAFQLRTYSIRDDPNAFVADQHADNEEDLADDDEADTLGGDDQDGKRQKAAQQDVTKTTDQALAVPLPGIPNFRTNDDSRIEITACASALAVSLAKSDFSSQSTEASVSGGACGVTAGVSAGYASSKSDSKKDDHENTSQTLVARYMYPRCDIFLRPEDLEPTADFAALLRRVQENRSLDALRQIQVQYGQLFCQELTLGARLLSTKMITTSKDASAESQKEQFKVSVGVSVQTPYGGASVKHEQEKGSEQSKSTVTTSSRESNVFEACGGDTILANNPSAWANSVSTPSLWRVINREALTSMVDMLSEMPGYQAAQMWFVQAIPALSKYIRLNASLSTNVRFKVEYPTNSLSCENTNNAVFYLGYDQGTSVTPRLNCRNETIDIGTGAFGPGFWMRIDLEQTKVLFNPPTYRAPVLHGFQNFAVGDGPFGSKLNAAFTSAQWEIISPFGVEMPTGSPYELKNMARVILRTVPFNDPNAKPTADGKSENPPPCHMTVFRNAQGSFLPAISDNDEYQYWRILKVGSDTPGEPIKGSDIIRLCWAFSDQVVGFRDFKDDVFGRRRNQCPPELASTVLYMKVPWPRFEVSGTPTALVMSAQGSTEEVVEQMTTLPGTFDYVLQDLKLRIDTVENRGVGDSGDYMLKGIQQEGDVSRLSISAGYRPADASNPMQVWNSVARFGVV